MKDQLAALGEKNLPELEQLISRDLKAFVRVGLALKEIKSRRLFEPQFDNFAEYCKVKWGFGNKYGYKLINAAVMVLELSPNGESSGKEVITCEGQVRELAKLKKPDLRRKALELASQASLSGPPSSRQIKSAVSEVLVEEHVKEIQAANSHKKNHAAGPDKTQPYDIIEGDSTKPDIIPAESVQLIIGSPPYNIGLEYPSQTDALPPKEYLEKLKLWLGNCFLWAADSGRLCLNVPIDTRKYGPVPVSSHAVEIALSVGWKYFTTILWDEGSHQARFNAVDVVASPQMTCRCEAILVFYKGKLKRENPGQKPDIDRNEIENWSNGLWKIPGSHKKNGHPSPYPGEIPKRLIKFFSYRGDVILDPWCGTGTTVVEALRLERRAIGIDIEPSFCAVAEKNVANAFAATEHSPD